MYCEKCGAKLEPNERFCPYCGEVVENASQAPSTPPPPPSPAPQSPPADPPAPDFNKKPGDKKPIIIGIAAAAVLLAVILAAVFLLGGKDKPDNAAVSPAPGQSLDPSAEPAGTGSASPSQPLGTQDPSAGPSEAPSADASQPVESATPSAAPASLSGLYIGTWAAEGCTVGDEENGWQALYLESVNGNTLTFALEKISAAMSFNRIARAEPITVTLENGKGTFLVENDGWFNSGRGVITVKGDAIHVTVDITDPDPNAMWDLTMDADFYPASSTSNQQGQPAQITVMVNGSALPLSQTPYLDNRQVMIPIEPVFEAIGIAVFEDMGSIVGLTESHAIMLTDMGGDYIFDLDGSEVSWDNPELVGYMDGCYFLPLDTLDVFGLQTSWDSAGKVASVQGTIASADRVSAQKIAALKQFDMDVAAQRVQNAGYSFAPAGADCGYWGGCKYWAIPVTTADGIQDAVTTYDGTYYELNVYPREYID